MSRCWAWRKIKTGIKLNLMARKATYLVTTLSSKRTRLYSLDVLFQCSRPKLFALTWLIHLSCWTLWATGFLGQVLSACFSNLFELDFYYYYFSEIESSRHDHYSTNKSIIRWTNLIWNWTYGWWYVQAEMLFGLILLLEICNLRHSLGLIWPYLASWFFGHPILFDSR